MRHEMTRVVEFLRTDGHSLLDSIGRSRDRLSEEMQFEDAARQHKRYEKVQEVLKLRDEMARDIDRLQWRGDHALAGDGRGGDVAGAGRARAGAVRFSFEVQEGKPVSLDRKLRETFAAIEPRKSAARRGRSIWRCSRDGITRRGAMGSSWCLKASRTRHTGSW